MGSFQEFAKTWTVWKKLQTSFREMELPQAASVNGFERRENNNFKALKDM
jgi:hypothetical protein